MADWLNIAGGAAKGYVEGTEDDRRRQEFNYMQSQRARQIKQQKIEDEQAAELGKVRTPGEYEDETAIPTSGDTAAGVTTGPPAGIKKTKTKVTEADTLRNQANVLARYGTPKDLERSVALRTAATVSQDAARKEQQAKLWDAYLEAKRMNIPGNEAATFRAMQQGYKLHPDGNELTLHAQEDGTQMVGVANQSGEFVRKPVPLTHPNLKAMLDEGASLISQADYWQGQKVGIDRYQAESGRMSAQAAMDNATTAYKKVMYETNDQAQAERAGLIAYRETMGKAAMIEANAKASTAAAATKKQTPVEKARELTEYYATIIADANPGMPPAQVKIKAAQYAGAHDANAKNTPDALGNEIVRVGGIYYKQDAKGEYKVWTPPADAKKRADAMATVLGVDDDGRGSAVEPNSNFRSVPTPSVTARSKGGAPIAERELDDWVPKFGKGVMGIGKRERLNRRTGETISEDEFNQRTAQ